jgi:hypothetical protein
MPPQQRQRLLDLVEELLRFRAHGNSKGRRGGVLIR